MKRFLLSSMVIGLLCIIGSDLNAQAGNHTYIGEEPSTKSANKGTAIGDQDSFNSAYKKFEAAVSTVQTPDDNTIVLLLKDRKKETYSVVAENGIQSFYKKYGFHPYILLNKNKRIARR